MIYLLDADTLIFMIRGLKSSNHHQASLERAQKLVDRCRQAECGVLKVWFSLLFLTMTDHASFVPRIAQQLDVYSATIRPCVGGAMTGQLTVGSEANALVRPRVEGIATC